MVDPEVIVLVRRYLDVLAEHGIQAEKAILFGSQARGTARPDSDIDILVLAEEFDGFAPGGFLHAIEFAQVEEVALDDALVGQTTIFDNAPVKMFFAIFAALGTTQKHDGVGSYR